LGHVEVGEDAGPDFAFVFDYELFGQDNRVALHMDIFKGVTQFVIGLLGGADVGHDGEQETQFIVLNGFFGDEDGGPAGVYPEIFEQGLDEIDAGGGGILGEGRQGQAVAVEVVGDGFIQGGGEAVLQAPRGEGVAAVGAADAELEIFILNDLRRAWVAVAIEDAARIVAVTVFVGGVEGRFVSGA